VTCIGEIVLEPARLSDLWDLAQRVSYPQISRFFSTLLADLFLVGGVHLHGE
jgi:hypothetical protein